MQHIDAILAESSDPAHPQNLGAAKSPDPTIRDRSAKQRALPIPKTARPFVSRCFEVKLPCVSKMVYIALAHRCKVWTDGTEGDVGRISRNRIAADAGLTLTRTKKEIASLVSAELVTIKRTGRTNIYTVRLPSAALTLANKASGTPLDREPWKAAGVSRRTWYRDRARTTPKTTHGGVRQLENPTVSSGTNGTVSSGTDGPPVGPSTEGGSLSSTYKAQRARETCESCGRTWLAQYGTVCHACGDKPRARSTTPDDTKPNHYGASATARSATTLTGEATTIDATIATGRERRGRPGR